MSDDTININSQGDVAFGKDSATVTINKTIQNSSAPDELKAKLQELAKAVEAIKKELPAAKAEEAAGDLQTLVAEAGKEEPRPKWYQLSGEGLIEAARSVGAIGQPVIDLTQSVLKLLAP